MKKPVIAVDGYSSTGKSSISKIIAQRLGLVHIDTGALYRGITYFGLKNCLENGIISINCIISNLSVISLEFRPAGDGLVLHLNGTDISREIRLPEVSAQVSFVAKQPEIRNFLLKIQQDTALAGGVILDGRDIGTVVFPNADYKFFLTASVEERTKRRYSELLVSGENIDMESVKNNLLMRDKIDSERSAAPLRQADDAILIDNTFMTKEATVEHMLSFIHR